MNTPDVQLGALHSYQQQGSELILDFADAKVAIQLLSPQLARIRLAPHGTFAARRSWAVVPPDVAFPGVSAELIEREDALLLRGPHYAVSVQRASGAIAFVDSQGRSFCADAAGLAWNPDGQVQCSKQIAEGEHFYGFGERTGLLDKRGSTLSNWTTDQFRYNTSTDPLYIAIPTFLALQPGLAYGVFFNNSWKSSFDMGAQQADVWQMQAVGGELDYYLVYGPSPADVSQGFAALLGSMPLPPRWALGYHQSRWGYRSEADVREIAAEFRRRELPCDVIHLDIDYMNGYRNFTWQPERFPDPAKLIADLRQQGIRIVTIIDAGVKVDPNYPVYADGLARDVFLHRADGEVFHGYVWPDDSVFADFLRPEVREWWGQQHRPLAALGVAGIWNDMNEPTVFARPFSQGGGDPGTIDLDAPQGPADERTTHAEAHNLYGSLMVQSCYQGMCQASEQRPFVLTRSGYAGVQRWSACWMGDNMSLWEQLEMCMPQLVNMGISGVPFVGVDIGGFHDNATGELFARWMQLGVLTPFARGHSCDNTERHEPWMFGPQVEAICREYLQLRYRLLPYLYSLFWDASQRGIPVLRPLFYHFPDDPDTYQLHDQVLLGPWLMAAPILHPGHTSREVYLPEGRWFDWWSSAQFEGPVRIQAEAPLERMPLYVRAGAIIPSGPELLYSEQRVLDPLTLDIYPGNGEFTLYEDDGSSFAYTDGQFCTTHYEQQLVDGTLQLTIGARSGAYQPAPRQLQLRVHGLPTQAAASYPQARYEEEQQVLSLQFADDGNEQTFMFILSH